VNWEAVGALSEIVGAAAVVISLLYLAIQVRTQNRESRLAATHEILEGYRNVAAAFQRSENAQLFAQANSDFDSLDEPQRIQLIALIAPTLRLWEEAFHQNKDGRFDDVMWKTFSKLFADVLTAEAVRKVWRLRENGFSDSFRAHVNAIEIGDWRTK
jgi:hypothetical protein